MRFLMVYRPAELAPPSVLDRLVEEMSEAGVLLATNGFRPPALATHVRIRGEEFEVSEWCEGPQGAIGEGYAVLQVGTRERAIELAKRFLAVAGDCAGEIQLLPG